MITCAALLAQSSSMPLSRDAASAADRLGAMVDDLLYNEAQNEVVFVKYLE